MNSSHQTRHNTANYNEQESKSQRKTRTGRGSTIPTTRTERRPRHSSLTDVCRRHRRSPVEQGLERGRDLRNGNGGRRILRFGRKSEMSGEREGREGVSGPGTRRRRRSPTMRRIAGDRESPAKRGRNKAPPRSVRFGRASRRGRRWWRRWESNPRPKRSHRGVYVRILRLGLAQEAARRRATSCASGHVGVDSVPATRTWSSLQDDASPLSRRRRFSVGA